MMLGKVDEVDGTYIATNYLSLSIIALIPLSSMWVTGVRGETRGRTHTTTYSGIELPIDWRSAAVGFARYWSLMGFAWVAMDIVLSSIRHNSPIVEHPLEYTVLCGVTALAAYPVGRLSLKEQHLRRMLAEVTGIPVMPMKLPHGIVSEVSWKLEQRLKLVELPKEVKALETLLPTLKGADLVLIWAWAEYKRAEDSAPRWIPLAKKARAAIEAAEFPNNPMGE